MNEIEKGTWIINSIKHLINVKTNTQELAYIEATETAGKSGLLLSRLVSDESEIIPNTKVKIFARESGITSAEFPSIMDCLRKQGKIDFSSDSDGRPYDVEVYCFSAHDALITTSSLFDNLIPSEHDKASLFSLEKTFKLPTYKDELIETITQKGFSENVANEVIEMQSNLKLIKTSREEEKVLYFNEYTFSEKPEKIAKAMAGLTNEEQLNLRDILNIIEENPGYLLTNLEKKFPNHIIKMMEGVGLIDEVEVYSDFGIAQFLTSPQLKGISLGKPIVSADVFHKAKVLLSCLRFGELKSVPSRGKIDTLAKMMNIVNKLISGDDVGPCTAIGQDYQLLERDGVIQTKRINNNMYLMKLRQIEVGILVKQMLLYKHIIPEADVELQKFFTKPLSGYTLPETRRTTIIAEQTKPVKDLRDKILSSLRTGMR